MLEKLLAIWTKRCTRIHHLHYWERLQLLQLSSVQRRAERYRILYCWKSLESLVPDTGIRATATNRGRLCIVPQLSKTPAIRKIRLESFTFQGAELFNLMPQEVRNLTGCTMTVFKSAVNSWLQQFPDQPAIEGRTPRATNRFSGRPSNGIRDWYLFQASNLINM